MHSYFSGEIDGGFDKDDDNEKERKCADWRFAFQATHKYLLMDWSCFKSGSVKPLPSFAYLQVLS